MLRIAHVTATFPPYFAGTGNVCYHNARLMLADGHAPTVYTGSVAPAGYDDGGILVRRLSGPLRVGNAVLLPDLLRMPRYDLVHLHYPFIFGAELIWLNRMLRGQPYVLTYHNDLVWQGWKGFAFRVYSAVWAQMILQRSRRVIVTALDFVAGSPLLQVVARQRPDLIAEVPNGVDTLRFCPRPNGMALRAKLGIPPHIRHVILFAGALDAPHHLKGGVPELLEAIARLRDPDLALVLAGGGDMLPVYRERAHSLGVAGQVHFADWVSHDKMPDYYTVADLVVQPSILFEPFGMVAIEAMASGRPVLASNLPGVRAVVGDGEAGVLVAPGNVAELAARIRMLLDDEAYRLALGRRGRMRAEQRYAWETVMPRLIRIYEEALAFVDKVA